MDAPWHLIFLVLAAVLFLISGLWWKAEPTYGPYRFSLISFGLFALTMSFLVH